MATTNTTAVVTTALIALVVVGGGAAIAAQTSEPGDFFYPLRASLFASDETRANASLEAAMEARDEAARLQTEGSLTLATRTQLRDRFTASVQEIEDLIDRLDADERLDEAARIRARLRAFLDENDSRVFDGDDQTSSASSVSSVSSASTSISSTSSSSMSSSSDDENDDDDEESSPSSAQAASAGASLSAGL